jgi:hypothetical protein
MGKGKHRIEALFWRIAHSSSAASGFTQPKMTPSAPQVEKWQPANGPVLRKGSSAFSKTYSQMLDAISKWTGKA